MNEWKELAALICAVIFSAVGCFIVFKYYMGKSEKFNEENFEQSEGCIAEIPIWLCSFIIPFIFGIPVAAIGMRKLTASLSGILAVRCGCFVSFMSMWIYLIYKKRGIQRLLIRYMLEWMAGASYVYMLMENSVSGIPVIKTIWTVLYLPINGNGLFIPLMENPAEKRFYFILQLLMALMCICCIIRNSIKNRR